MLQPRFNELSIADTTKHRKKFYWGVMKGLTFTVIDLYILLTKPGLSLTISTALAKYFFYLALADDQGYGRNDPDQKTYRTIGLVFLFGGLFTLLTPV